jgi:uncharacterized membrane protein YhhN
MAPSGVAILGGAAISAICHLRAESRGPRWQVYLFKPLTTALLVALAMSAAPAQGPRYHLAVSLGLALSLVGDVFLMLPKDRFVAGLASFLAAHLAYLVAFTSAIPFGSAPLLVIPFFVTAWILTKAIWSGLGRRRPAVLLYTAIIVLMVWRAWARGWEFRTPGAWLAAAGATLFMASDALLALNRFRRPFPAAQAAVMTTYVAAQALIASSVGTP